MAQDKIKALYDTFVKEGYEMESEAQFRKNLADPAKRKAAYDALVKDGYEMEAYDAFETNIGFGKQAQTAQAPAQSAPQPTPAPTAQPKTETPAPQQEPTPAPAPVEKAPEEPRWQPTEQDKIRMAYNLNTMMSDFNKRSRARVEQTKRALERNTPEGRKRQKAAKFQAQLAGTPTQVMGLTPNVSTAPATDGAQGEGGDAPKPLLSGQGPVPYGVVIENGERKTQWLLPDGTLTTDLVEADKAEYGARRVRLMNQFVGRMRENGLDPSKQEDIQRQAQLDYEAPIRKAVAEAVAEDDKRSQAEQDAYMSNPMNMIGGVNAELGHAAARKQAGIGDLSLIAERAYESLPSYYRRELVDSYTEHFKQHPEDLHGKSIAQAAQDAAKSAVYREVHETYVGRNTPKSGGEFFVRKMLELNPASVMLSSTVNPSGQAYAELDAMDRYGADHRVLSIAGMVAGMAIDPTTYISGGVGNIAMKGAMRTAGKQMIKGAGKEMAERFAGTRLAGRIIGGVAGGSANFATFEALKDAERQAYQGGYVNPETGEIDGFSFGSVLNSGVHGAMMGAATGSISPLIGNVADKAVKATSTTAGKMGVRGAELLTSTVAEGTIFSIPDWISGEQDAFDVWTYNMAMMAGFKLSHAIKSAPSVIASLRPVTPKDGRPLTREERIHNRKSFGERLREGLDRGQSITNDEREELRKYGYGELSDLFAYDPEHKSRKVDAGAERVDGEVTGVRGLSRAVDYKPELEETSHPEFDGYEAMERLMDDNRVSEATRAKAYYILTGRMLPMSTVTGWNQERAEDGSIIVQSLSNQGGVVTSKRFANDADAQREIDAIKRQAELNTIDVGEQYREAEAEFYGRESARPQAIRERISDETGVDLDKALRKEPGKRTEQEQEAVDRYARELFPEPEQYKPSAEEAEADRIYEESRQLYGRYEQGEPEAQGEIDAIALRMNEAYQLAEDAFGAESEYYMTQMREEPWTLLNDPDLTEDQREAVLYCINADAALKGVMDASNEASQDKRDQVSKEIQHRTHTERGVIVPVTIKADGRQTYLVKGDVAMFPDGTGVDVRNSSEHIIILDEQGEYKFSSPDQILSVGETIDPSVELQTAYDTIDREQESIFSGVEMPYEPGTAESGEPTSEEALADPDENIPTEGNNGDENIPTEGNNGDENIPMVNVEEYDRGYSDAIEEAQNLTDERLDHYVESLREGAQKQMQETGRVDDYIRGRLEALEYAQQERRESVPKTEESVPNDTENVVSEGEIASETFQSAEAGEETALSRIPVNDEGEPIFESAPDPATAWDGLVEAAGDDAGASEIAQAQIAQATSDLEKLKKKPPTMQTPKLKGTPMAMAKQRREAKETYDKAMEDYNQQIADTEGRLNAWHRILAVQTSRNAELRRQQEAERRQRDAELHDAAVADFEEQQRIKAEKQAEQDAIGTHAVNPKIREKWETAPKTEGHEDEIKLPDGSTISGRYILTEAGAASASHDINNAFAPTEGFPIDKNGQSVNDRDYARDKDAQRIVEQMADQYDNRALQDPVIVSKDGVVLSGNNRTMSGDLAARQGTDTAYNEYLRKYGRKYGFTPEQVAGMKNPRVVFVPDETLPYDATTFARFNAQEKKSQSKPEAAVKLGKVVPDNVFTNIVNEISRYDRLSGFYADERAVAQTLGALMSAGVINDKQMPELRTGTTLSAAGKELIENTLIGKVFQSNPEAVRQIIAIPTLRETVVMGLSEIANNRTLQKQGFDLSDELAKAIDLVQRAKAAQPDVFTEGVPVSPFGRMQGLFDDEYGDSRVTDATTLLLADILNSGKPSDLRKVLATYNSQAANSAVGQRDIFTGEVPTKEEILTNVNEHFRQSTPKEQQALVEAAIAERKQRAEAETGQRGGSAESEQTADALQRDGEREESAATAGAVAESSENSDEELRKTIEISKRVILKKENAEEAAEGIIQSWKKMYEQGEEKKYPSSYANYLAALEVLKDLSKKPTSESEQAQTPVGGEDASDLTPEEEALAKRVQVTENEWEEGDPDHPTYKREILIDGKHSVTQVDTPDSKGNYNGSLFMFDFKAFGSIAEVADYIDSNTTAGLDDMSLEGVLAFTLPADAREMTVADVEDWEPLEREELGAGDNKAAALGILEGRIDPNDEYFRYGLKLIERSLYKQGILSKPRMEVNLNPTEAQKKAGNYKKGHVKIEGMDISIENPRNTMRRGIDADGTPWETRMTMDYGYIRGTQGKDKDHIDIFLTEIAEEKAYLEEMDFVYVYVIDQYNKDGSFDEHKVVYGIGDENMAKMAYLENYSKDWAEGRRIEVTEVTMDDFKKWAFDGKRKIKPFAEYKAIKELTKDADQTPTNVNADGMIVDADNKPLTLYHGTPNKVGSVTELEPGHERGGEPGARYNGEGVSFTPDISVATDYANDGTTKGRIFKANVSLKNPYYTLGVAHFTPEDAAAFTAELKAKGHDGIINYSSASMRESGALPAEVIVFDKSSIVPVYDEVTEGFDYTITPTTYTNKKGKTSDVWLVKFDRDLSKEEKAALDTYTRGPLAEGKKTSRGWYDRNEGGYMMRSEEAAQALADMIENPEAVADAQPLSKEDIKEGVRKKKAAPKPKNTATLEEIAEDKPTETPAPAEKPAEAPKEEPKGQFKVTDEMREQEDELRRLLGIEDDEGDRGIYFRDDELTPEERRKRDRRIFALGVDYACNYIDNGIVAFPDFAKAIVGRLGQKVKPFIKAWYDGLRRMPDYTDKEFTAFEDVSRFDIENFDKPDYDALRDAEMRLAERKAQEASEEAEKTLIEQRNEQRKEDDKQRETDTAALADKGAALASEAESIAETSEDAGELAGASEKIDKVLEEVNEQLALLGYYEAEEVDKDFNEAYGYMRNAEKKALKDAVDLTKQLVNDLGIEIDKVSGTPTAKKSKTPTAVRANIAPAGGDINITLPLKEGKELHIYIGLDPADKEEGEAHNRPYYRDDLAVRSIMYRVENPNASGYDRYGSNQRIKPECTYSDLLKALKYETRGYLPQREKTEEPYDAGGYWDRHEITETEKNGFKVGEKVWYTRNDGKGKRELATIVDFGGGSDVTLDTGMAPIMYEACEWSQIAKQDNGAPADKPADAPKEAPKDKPANPAMREVDVMSLMGAVSDATKKTQQDGQEREVKLSDHYKPETAGEKPADPSPADKPATPTEMAAEAAPSKKEDTGEKKEKKPRKKPVVKPEQTVGDLFSGLFDEPETPNKNEEKKTDVQSRPGTGERERGHEPRQDEPMGKGERNEAERTDGGRVGGRDNVNPMSDGGGGARVSRKPKSAEPLERLPEAERKNIRNNRAERGTDYAPKAEEARIKANIQAIELAKQLLESGATATPEQMATLRKFSGWGGLGRAFNENNPTSRQLRNLLGEEGYEQANMSRNSAYYTPAEVIDTMWDIAKAMGFQGGNVLEGSAGIGNILGLMPAELSDRSNIHAVEIDGTTGGILSLLYPDAKVDIQGFEQTKIRNNSVDLAITNVPFVADLHVMDKTGDKDLSTKFRDIHDFCIAKNIRKLREGGIGIFITSNGTMDNSARLRAWITNEGNADVVGAFRMHNKTFGGTGATSDIIVVRKRVNGKPSPNAINVTDVTGVRTAEYDTGETKKVAGQEIPIIKTLPMEYNKYFAEHPENVAGEMRFGFEEGDTYRPQSKALYPVKEKNQSAMLKTWAEQFRNMKQEDEAVAVDDSVTRLNEQLGEGVKEGSMILNSQGELCVARMGEAVPIKVNKNKVKGHTKAECFKAYTAIKKALKDVLDYQATNDDNKGLEPLLKELNRTFDNFTRTYGNLHKNTAISFLRNDVDFSSILALETYSEKGDKSGKKIVKVGKTDIFSRRVIETEKEPQPKDIKDGILASLYKNGGVDVDYIAEALGKSAEEVRKEIVESGLGFENPATGNMEVSYQYLSGNVREKLHIAEENNEDGRYDKNVSALQQALPMTIPAHLIEFSLGSSWIDHRLYEDFVEEKTGLKVELTNAGGTWFMKRPRSTFNEKNRAMSVVSKICGKTIMGDELLEAAITNKTITVSKTERHYDGSTETINDPEATRLCATKIDELRAEFKDWARAKMQKDSDLSEKIERTYNEQFNNYVPLTIPEDFVPKHFGGQVSELHGRPFALRPHQGRAVVKATTQPVLLAHEVGTGKTYTLITTAMEMRRLGTARKPMIVVQNATVGQFVESAKEIYPNAKVLTIEEADRTAEGRKNFYAKIKYNDWDMIVVPQSVFERIPDSEEREMAYVKGIIEEKLKVLDAMREADNDGRSMVVRQAEKELELQEERLAELTKALETKRNNKDAKREAKIKQNAEVKALEMLDREVDDVENFDDMGIDAILVDEAHEYKHLGFATAMQRGVKGVDPSYSKKSQGVYLKAQAVLEHNNGRNVVFATGTPISNTAAEIWTFMRYLMPADTMKAYGIYYFDDFVRNFGNISQMVEFTTSGKFKENNRFAGYINLPELVRIWSSVADTVLTRDAGGVSDKIPDIEGGKAQDIYLPQSRTLRSIMLNVKEQLDKYEKMTGKEKKENSHIPLVMYGIAKAAAVDARLVLANAPDEPNSKTNATVRSTLEALEKSKDYKGTVAIFADNYQNKSTGFNLYEDIRDKLIAQGVPADEIVIIKSGMTVKRKLDIFEKVNAGEIRVVMGSTFTLGTGVNIQERLYRAIHIDAPNRPMDYTQRNGRILRQGNLHKDMGIPVSVVRFGVEDSLDVTAYQRLKTKGAIADSIMNGSKMMQNSMENRVLEEEEDTFGDMTAQLSGSEYAILKNQAEREVRSLTAKQKNHEADQIYIHNKLPEIDRYIRGAEWRIETETNNLEAIGKHWPDGKIKNIKIGKLSFKSIAEMEDFIKEQNAKLTKASGEMKQGGGEDNYTSMLTIDIDGMEFIVTSTIRPKVAGVGQLSLELERSVSYTCPALNIKDCSPSGQRLKAVLEDIEQNIVTGERSRSLLHNGEAQLSKYSEERKILESRKGAEFPYTKELNEAKARLSEYEAAMKKEMEAKEKKYAELDKTVEMATGITLSDEDGEETPTNGDGNKYRLVEDNRLLEKLDSTPLKKGFRYSQWANMGILPPMTAKKDGEWRPPMVFRAWEQSEEGMRKANGKADLVQGNGRTTGDVAYNPYFHIRTSPLNDQFTAAYDRPELIVVEGYYPESEETSGYRAEGAKDSVGLMDWHSGSVNGQLSEETKVQTMLSRYFKPERIVPWSEVAENIMERVGDQKIVFPINAVPPMLRYELAKRGAKFGDISGSVAESDVAMLNDLRDRVNAGEYDAGLEKAREYLDAYESSDEAKETRVEQLSQKLNTPVRIIRTREEANALPTRRQQRAKGWMTPEGEVVVVVPNNDNVADVENTVVHEVVGHKGLRALVGEERMGEFLDEVYDHASDSIKKKIDKKEQELYDRTIDKIRERKRKEHERKGENPDDTYFADMAEAHVEARKQKEQMHRDATEEYMADLGGKIRDEGFEKMAADELTLWGKIKERVMKFLDKFLQRLKIPKGIRLTDKDLSYILYKSWKNLRERGPLAEAQDISIRRRSGYDADERTKFRDPGMGLEETITKMKAEAMQANADNLQAKRDAMRAIGGNLNHLRSAMARQREYDITTVKSVSDLAKILMEAGLLDDLSQYETKRILGAVNNVVGKQDVSQYVQKVMDIMVDNQLRNGQQALGKLLTIKGSRVDARGIEVQGELDPDGQRIAKVVRKSTSLPKDEIENLMAEAMNRMSSNDQTIADEAALDYAGLQIAHQYAEDITESKAEEKALRDSIKKAKEDKDAGQMTDQAYRQYVDSTNDAIRQNKIDRAEAYQSLVEQIGDTLSESIERARAWREAERQRIEDIHHNANSDMEGRPTDEHHKDNRIQKFTNNSAVRFLLAPLGTFDQMLRMFGKKNTRGEGYLWNRYMRGWVDASEKEYNGYQDALKVLDRKVSEVFGKDMSWGDLFTIDRRLPKASVRFWDGGEMKEHELTQGNLLYIYMADKMTDGRMKLRRMGITEDDVTHIKNFLDPRFIELADWMQEEFLVDKRNEYNEVHKRMFGASMAAIENYFPLKILSNARIEEVDVADDTTDTALPATSTGSIIKRRRNNLALDVTGANAFSVILDHIQQMERWAAFAEFNRDLNTLLSYKRFRNQVMNMNSVYGAGKTLWNNFRNVCSMAAGAYRPPIAALDKSAVNIAKGVTAAKVSFRVFTALKQFLSMPAYLSDSNPLYLATNLANPFGAWKWSMENLPLFEKRWKSRMAGDPRLLKSEMDWKMWRSRVVELASRVGMSPNAFVDALTVAIGSHTMYQTKLAKYKRQGYEPDDAERRAKQDATILFNQTQQSSEGAFLSTMQVDRSWLSVLFTVFRNSSMSYTRQLYDAVRNIGHRLTPGYKGMSEEFMAKQMRRDGIDPDRADANAKQEYRRGIIRDIARIGVFGFALQMAWNLGAYLPYLLCGEDEDEKSKMWTDIMNHTYFGSVEGLTGGDVMSAAGQMWLNGEENLEYLAKDMPLAADIISILKKMPKDQAAAMNDVVNLLVQSGVGVNPQSLTDAVVAIMDYCGENAESQRECALLITRILNCPQSQIDKIYFDELGMTGEEASRMTPAEIAERYADYKLMREAPLTGWTRSEATRDSLAEKRKKRVLKTAGEKINNRVATEETRRLLGEYDDVAKREREIGKLKTTDRQAYVRERSALNRDTDMAAHMRVKRYRRDMKELTEKYLRTTDTDERDSIVSAMIAARDIMLNDINNRKK